MPDLAAAEVVCLQGPGMHAARTGRAANLEGAPLHQCNAQSGRVRLHVP